MTDPCRWCGQQHQSIQCPRVKAVEFAADGETVRRVEFFSPADNHVPWRLPMGVGPAVAVYPLPFGECNAVSARAADPDAGVILNYSMAHGPGARLRRDLAS